MQKEAVFLRNILTSFLLDFYSGDFCISDISKEISYSKSVICENIITVT